MAKKRRDPEKPVFGLSEEEMKDRHRSALEKGDQELATDTAYLMGARWMGQDRRDEVEQLCLETLEHFEDSRLLHYLARIESESDRQAEALEHFERALACSRPLQPTSAVSVVVERGAMLHNFAVLLVTGNAVRESAEPSLEVDRAIELWREALATAGELDDEDTQRMTLIRTAFAMIAYKCGPDRTDMLWERLADLLVEVGDGRVAATMLHHRGVTHYKAEELERAEKYFRKSLALATDAGDLEGVTASTLNLDSVLSRLRARMPN